MSIFISWSGEGSISHQIAELLRDWIPKVIQRTDCYMSSEDNGAGIVWVRAVLDQLDKSNLGILCLTAENLKSPWLNFEAGAIAKRAGDARLCPLLIDVSPNDVNGPLAAFQMKSLTKKDMYEVMKMVNLDHQEGTELKESFEDRWPKLEEEIERIKSQSRKSPAAETRTSDDILREILAGVRSLTQAIADSGLKIGTTVASGTLRVTSGKEKASRIFDELVQTLRKSGLSLFPGWKVGAMLKSTASSLF